MATQIGPEFYDTDGVRRVLAAPGGEPVSEREVGLRRDQHAVMALPTQEGWVYPAWQFRNFDVLPGLAEVLAAFHSMRERRGGADGNPLPRPEVIEAGDSLTRDEPWSSWSVATWMTTPLRDLSGSSVAEWLLEGRDSELVVRLARRTAGAWAV